jgi:thymidylate kinase
MWSSEQATALSAVFDALNQSEIKWLVLRNYEGLPEVNRSKDIDLGLEKENMTRAENIITETLLVHRFDRLYKEDFQYVRCLTFFNVGEDRVLSIKVDLLDGFVWRGAQLFEFGQLYSSRVPNKVFFVPDPVDDGVMLWMKPLLTGGFVKTRYVDDIQRVSSSYPEQFRERMLSTFGQTLTDEVWPLIQQGRLAETIPYQHRLAWTAWLRAVFHSPIKTLIFSLSHLISEIVRRASRKPASLISVAGPDGVGKTTFINLLKQELARILVKDPESIQVTHFRPNILPNIKQLFSGRKYDASTEEFTKPHRATPASPPSSLVRLTYYWLDYLLGYWLVNRRKCTRGMVMIFDRYFYDFIVDPRRSRINLPTWVRKLFLHLTPQPDLVFFLVCDADTVYARKQELSQEEIARQLCEYRKLGAAYPKRFVCLDANLNTDEVVRKALFEIVTRSFQRM